MNYRPKNSIDGIKRITSRRKVRKKVNQSEKEIDNEVVIDGVSNSNEKSHKEHDEDLHKNMREHEHEHEGEYEDEDEFEHEHEHKKEQHHDYRGNAASKEFIREVQKIKNKRSRRDARPFVRILVPIVLGVLFSFWGLNQLESAVIWVTPAFKHVEVQEEVSAYKEASDSQLPFYVISYSESKELELTPDDENIVRKIASGKIKIFNDFSESPQLLAPNTRFEAADGKIFRTGDEEILVPGKENNRQGEIVATIYADKAGEEYNIDVTNFSIPGYLEQGLSDQFGGMGGISLSKFSGGFSGLMPKISDDLKAKKSKELELLIQNNLQETLATEKTPNKIFVENSASIVFKEPEYDLNEGFSTGTFKVTGTFFALLVDTEELGDYLSNRIIELQEGAKVNLSSRTKIIPVYKGNGKLDYKNTSKISLSLEGDAYYIWDINKETIKNNFSGSLISNIESLAEADQSIGIIKVNNHPRWSDAITNSKDKIQINLR